MSKLYLFRWDDEYGMPEVDQFYAEDEEHALLIARQRGIPDCHRMKEIEYLEEFKEIG